MGQLPTSRSIVTLASGDADAQVRRWVEHDALAVVALCAAWCDTCTEFQATLERLAQARPGLLFVWLDIEDDSEICGDIDIENFPTLAIYRGERLLHFGVSLPVEGTVRRLIDEIAKRPDIGLPAPQGILDLPRRLRAHLPGQAS